MKYRVLIDSRTMLTSIHAPDCPRVQTSKEDQAKRQKHWYVLCEAPTAKAAMLAFRGEQDLDERKYPGTLICPCTGPLTDE